MGFTLEKASKDVLGSATKVVITKDSTVIVTDGSTRAAVEKRVYQLRRLVEVQRELCHLKIISCFTFGQCIVLPTHLFHILQNTEENFQKKILNERIARLSGGIAILQVI